MCNLNIIIKNNDFNVTGFLQLVTAQSYEINKDGDGIYISSSDRLVQSNSKIDLTNFINEINQSNFILSHQRLSTSGSDEDIQPVKNDNFVFMHNGIISTFATKEKSDTYNLFEIFNATFEELIKSSERDKALIDTIKTIFDNLEGSFSIAIYDKISDKLYYFKNYRTWINFFSNDKIIYITTSHNNKEWLYMIENNKEFTEYNLKDYTIYEFSVVNGIINCFTVGELQEKPLIQQFKTEEPKKGNKKSKKKKESKERKKYKTLELFIGGEDIGLNPLIEMRATLTPCYFCKADTFNFWVDGGVRVCDECISEGILTEAIENKWRAIARYDI